MLKIKGAAASPGIGTGAAYVMVDQIPAIPELDDPIAAFKDAGAAAAAQLTRLAGSAQEAGREDAAEILKAQALMAEDPTLADQVGELVGNGTPLAEAIQTAADAIKEMLLNSGSEYLAARAADIQEIVRRVRFAIAGSEPPSVSAITEPVVIVATDLTAADTATMSPELVRGFVTEGGGPTGHVAVIARSLGIPAVVGAAGAVDDLSSAAHVLVDGGTGEVVADPDESTVDEYRQREATYARRALAAATYQGAAVAYDGRRLTVATNVGNVDEITQGRDVGADGIGLFRTEFLFLDRPEPPTEEEQVEAYTAALEAFEHPVVIRTFDIGGDKPASYLDLPAEENPFLGVRGMRLYALQETVALTQARALLRASLTGDLWVMAPMVTTIADVAALRQMFSRAREELEDAGMRYGQPRLGIMVEVPAVAAHANAFARHVDFFSIGTNDLTQYTMAADRTSGSLAAYNDAADPAVLRLCSMTAAAAGASGISVSVCGEAAADPGLAVLFAAMGMDKLSVAPPAVNATKLAVAEAEPQKAARLLEAALEAATAADVRELLADSGAG